MATKPKKHTMTVTIEFDPAKVTIIQLAQWVNVASMARPEDATIMVNGDRLKAVIKESNQIMVDYEGQWS